MNDRNKPGVSLWKNERWEKGSPLPVFRGKITLPEDVEPGQTYDIALWPNVKPTSEKSPQLTGKVSPPFKPTQKPAKPSKPAADFDDDLPF